MMLPFHIYFFFFFFQFIYSVRILEVQQTGVVDFWDTWIRPMPPQCNGKPQSGNKKKKTTPLSLEPFLFGFSRGKSHFNT
jgi:hypothetical protein